MSKTVNCCIIGDSMVGKTCLVDSYTSGAFPRDYKATILDVYSALVNVGDDSITLRIFDLSGLKNNASYRKEIVKNCDVAMLCYSMISSESLQSIENYWIHEIRDSLTMIPMVLVGTQSDIVALKSRDFEPIGFRAKSTAAQLGISRCLECSALTQDGLKHVFDEAIGLALNITSDTETLNNKKKCFIM